MSLMINEGVVHLISTNADPCVEDDSLSIGDQGALR